MQTNVVNSSMRHNMNKMFCSSKLCMIVHIKANKQKRQNTAIITSTVVVVVYHLLLLLKKNNRIDDTCTGSLDELGKLEDPEPVLRGHVSCSHTLIVSFLSKSSK